MLRCGSDQASVPESWQCVSSPASPRSPFHRGLPEQGQADPPHQEAAFAQLRLCTGPAPVQQVRHLAQLIDHSKPDTENLLLSAAIRKRELLVLAGLVLLSDGVDIRSRREALVLLRWCAATQPVAPYTKVMEEVEFLTIQAQHGLSLEAKQWAGAGLAMLACQKETERLVLHGGSAGVLSSLMLQVLAQPGVDLQIDILAQCGRFITHVTPMYPELELAQMCIPQLAVSVTERLVMELGGGGDVAAEACRTLLDLLKTQPQAFVAAFTGTGSAGEEWHGVPAVVSAVVAALHKELDRDTAPAPGSDKVSAASGPEDEAEVVLKQPLSCEGRTKGLAASLLSLLRHLLVQAETSSNESWAAASSEAATAASAHEGAVSLLVRCLPGEGGAEAMHTLSFLLAVPKARADLLSAGGAVDEVAAQWRLAPAAAARALWHMRQQLQGRLQFETLLQLLRHPASPDESSSSSSRRYGDALECVKSIETSGAWGSWDPPQQGAPQDLLTALDLCWGHLQELSRSEDTAECVAILMELWALLSRHRSTATQLVTVGSPAAGAVDGALPCCVRAALDKLQEEAGAEKKEAAAAAEALSSHMALLLNLLRACCAQQLQPSWMRQVLDSFLKALHLQLQHHAAGPGRSREPPDLQALQLSTQLCLMSSGDRATAQLQPLTPHKLLPSTWTCSSPEAGSPAGAGSGGVEGPAAPWRPLDVLEAKLGLVQRLMAPGTEAGVLHLLLPQLLSGPLASDTPPPPSDYTPLLNATPGAMRRQVLELLKQAAEAQHRAVPTDCWAKEILDQALDAARSCKGGQPCKQKLANCVAAVALWLDVVLQPDLEVSDDAALSLQQPSVQERLQGMVPWALELLQLLMECTAAADAVMPTVAPAPTTVFQASGSILELLCLQLHSAGPLPGLSLLESRRWFLPGGRLRAATPEQRSIVTVMTLATVAAEAKEQELQHQADMDALKAGMEALRTRHTAEVAAEAKEEEAQHKAEMDALKAEMEALKTSHTAEVRSMFQIAADARKQEQQRKAEADLLKAELEALKTKHTAEVSHRWQVAADARKQEQQHKAEMDVLKAEMEALKTKLTTEVSHRWQVAADARKQEQQHKAEMDALRAEMEALKTRRTAELAWVPVYGQPVTEKNVRPGLRVQRVEDWDCEWRDAGNLGTTEGPCPGFPGWYCIRWDSGVTSYCRIGGQSGLHDLKFT